MVVVERASAPHDTLRAAVDDALLEGREILPSDEMRVRAINSKGQSDWCSCTFRTKQKAVEGGGVAVGVAELDELASERLAGPDPEPADTAASSRLTHAPMSTYSIESSSVYSTLSPPNAKCVERLSGVARARRPLVAVRS